MDVNFMTKKLEKIIINKQKAIKTWGPQAGLKVMQRLKELEAAPNLYFIKKMKSLNFHLLKGNRRGTYAINVSGGLRIVLKPDHDPIPTLQDGSINLSKVTRVTILEVIDYHD